ncbi:MAG: tyrosine-type recombinase/integrase [Rhodocyclaceae bacterium]
MRIWRDYRILHLIAHYGMRPSEVVALRIDSIDWDAEILHIYQRKTSTALDLPLAKPTLRILKDYPQHDRTHYGHAYLDPFLRACRREAGAPGASAPHT